MPRRFRSLLPFVVALPVLLVGCGKPDEVTSYSVQKPAAVFKANHDPRFDKKPVAPVEKQPARMIAAMLDRPDATYFFKLQDDPDVVEPLAEEIHEFLRSVQFPNAGPPQWSLPETWTETKGGNDVRISTIHVGEGRVELAVTKFPAGQEKLGNVNRWRKLLGVKEFASVDEFGPDESTEVIEKPWGELIVVDLTGEVPSAGGAMSPTGGGRPRPTSPHGSSPHGPGGVPKATSAERLVYTTPAGWVATEASGERVAAFTIESGEDIGKLFAFQFGGGNPEVVLNVVNLWLSEMGREKLAPGSDLADVTEPVQAKAMVGQLVDLSKPGDAPDREALLGVVFPTKSHTWVVKFTGPKRLLEAERERFDTFLASLDVTTKDAKPDDAPALQPDDQTPDDQTPDDQTPDDQTPATQTPATQTPATQTPDTQPTDEDQTDGE